jgi:phage terminase small subunit
MQSLILQNIPDHLYFKIEEMAKQDERNINAQVLKLLANAIAIESSLQNKKREQVRSILAEISHRRKRRSSIPDNFPDSTELIREDRER